jgi:hypothetical protein
MILVRWKLGVQWWDERYLEWLLQGGAAFAVVSIVLSLPRPLNAITLAICLMAMYAAAVAVSLLRGWHEDDKQLLRYSRHAVRARLRFFKDRPVISFKRVLGLFYRGGIR